MHCFCSNRSCACCCIILAKATLVKAAGLEIQLKSAAVALSAASAKAPDEEITADRAVGVLSSVVPDEMSLQRLAEAKVLWVDDRPEGNRFERSAMQQLGIAVDLSTSTEDASSDSRWILTT